MTHQMEGQQVPRATLRARRNGEWVDITNDDLFKDQKVVLFALPGAFTPTCSSTHLPRYDELAPTFFATGVDKIICLSVNDAFVMEEWKRNQQVEHVNMIPDGNGEFSAGMGMLVDKQDLGFGKRSWRYSMLVNDGVIEKMFVEPEVPGDPFEVSDADTMLNYINPNANRPTVTTMFTKPGCPHCARAKGMLQQHGYHYEEIELGEGVTPRSVRAVSGSGLVPQVFIDGSHIGGADKLEQWLRGK